jgi:hypothetical protein
MRDAMTWPRPWPIRFTTAVAVACALLVLSPAMTAAWAAEPPLAPPSSPHNEIAVGRDVVVAPDKVVSHVVVVRGDAIIGGLVTHDVVAVGGDVVLLSTAVVQQDVICVGGRIVRQPGSVAIGNVVTVRSGIVATVGRWLLARPSGSPFSTTALVGWLITTIVYLAITAGIASLAPRGTTDLADRVTGHPAASLGWGMLAALVVVPLVSVALFVTVVGIALLIPWLVVVVPVALLFGFVGTSAGLGRGVLRLARVERRGLVLEALAGAAVADLTRLIPYAGLVTWLLVWTIGLGAVSVLMWTRVVALGRRARARSRSDATTTRA